MKHYLPNLMLLLLTIFFACGKSSFLEQVPGTSLHVPRTLENWQKILDNENLFGQTHGLTMVSADQFYCTDLFWLFASNVEKNAYTWNRQIFSGDEITDDWVLSYSQVYNANEALAGVSAIPKNAGNMALHHYIEGSALFMRAYAFYNLAQAFAPLYDDATADTGLGIPLRMTPDINEISTRSTVRQTYDRIITDAKRAVQLLPQAVDHLHPNRPSKPSAYAFLARVCLSMRKYEMAGKYADSCLQLHNKLIDYNSVDPTSPTPFTATNEETIYQSTLFSSSGLVLGIANGFCLIDSALYQTYGPNDLRRTIFFSVSPEGNVLPKGSYYGARICFTGLATDEIYLIRAECFARAGSVEPAMADLNTLLKKRWRNDYFVPLTASGSAEALQIILRERNKELVLRGQRWTDLRRLNKENASIPLAHFVDGQRYDLPPNDIRYVLPIPEKVIQLTGMIQNPR